MNRCALQLTLGLLIVSPLLAQDSGPSTEFKQRASQWMVSTAGAKRKAAYRSWLQLGPEALPAYRQALANAASYHSTHLEQLARGHGATPNPYAAHQEQAKQLDEERVRVMALLKTDWKKDPAKIAMLRDAMVQLEKLSNRVNHLAAADTKRFDVALDALVGGMMEVTRELERFDSAAETAAMDDAELKAHLLQAQVEGCLLPAQQDRFELTRKHSAALAAAEKANAALDHWATPAMKSFATLLNSQRCVMGLTPLLLEEKLAAATRGHSEDMARLGFFAHNSPVAGKTTPWDRARLAGFQGSGTGENIYTGSPSFEAAYQAWFGSDGHRFIMFGDGCNVLGVGIAGVIWTMMTGRTSG